ncbi:MAG: trehalase family glycosidase, partial [bacterium]
MRKFLGVFFLLSLNVLGASAFSPLEEAKNSYLDFSTETWSFRIDPEERGEQRGWANPDFDDQSWDKIYAGEAWESQGFSYYNGHAWYRKKVWIPEEWQGSVVRFEVDGVGDEYDLFVEGKNVGHRGGGDFGSFYAWPSKVEIQEALHYGAFNTIAVKVIDLGWSEGGGLWRRVAVRRVIDLKKFAHLIPHPIIEGHSEWLALYRKTWQILWENLSYGNSYNKYGKVFLEEGFNEQIYQWDSSFMTVFAKYARQLFPAIETLDNFYIKQKADGYIQRSYSVTSGDEAELSSAKEPAVNPPLFAWAELEYAKYSGETGRLAEVLPKLEKYYMWIKQHMRTPYGQGLYYQTQLGSGMDNTPRGDSAEAAWVDMSMQQALAAKNLSEICQLLNLQDQQAQWKTEYEELKSLINQKLWNEKDHYYYDLQRNGEHAGVRHIGSYWALLAGIPDSQQATSFIGYLKNDREFHRKNLFPTLSASSPFYHLSGAYWRGSVWAPTNYMTIKGLEQYNEPELAYEASVNYLDLMTRVYKSNIDPKRITALDRIDGFLHTLWECYAPESDEPCSPGADKSYSRANFVGWSGLGPVALLIENVVGLKLKGLSNEIEWNLREPTRIGMENLYFGKNLSRVSLVAEVEKNSTRIVRVQSETSFKLKINYKGKVLVKIIKPGNT